MSNVFGFVMQAQGLTPFAQWVVIGLSISSLLLALVVSGTTEIPTWKVRVVGAVAVALVMAVLVANASAAIFIECKDGVGSWWWIYWGC